MINKRDIPTKCTFLLSQWKENLNLTNYERTKFDNTLNQLDFQIKKLTEKELQISVYGRVGVGKSSLLNALIDKQLFPTDILNGNTKATKSYTWDKRFQNIHKVELTDSPGMDEINNSNKDESNFLETNAKSINVKYRLKGHKGVLFHIDWDTYGDKLISVSDDRTLRCWELKLCGKTNIGDVQLSVLCLWI